MKRYGMVALLILCAAATWARSASDDAKDEQVLKQLVRTWDEAFVKGDTATLDHLLAAEFEFVGGAKKTDYLSSFKTRAKDAIESALSTDLKVQIYGDAAIVTGIDTIGGKRQGEPYVSKWLYMDVWIKRDGRWQCVKTYSSATK